MVTIKPQTADAATAHGGEQYGIGGSLQRRETNIPGNQPNEELYRFGADGTLRLSGFYEHDIQAIRAKAEELGLSFDHNLCREDWVAVRFAIYRDKSSPI